MTTPTPDDLVSVQLLDPQKEHLSRSSGIDMPDITLSRLILRLSAATSLVTGSKTLLVSTSGEALDTMRQSGAEGVKEKHYTVSLELVEAQKQLLKSVTGQEFSTILLIPDDAVISYPENWKQESFLRRAGQAMVVVSPDRVHELAPNDHPIILKSGNFAGFGTGMHPTTRLCLSLLENHVKPGDRALDVGTGSGILAIAAARLGAAKVLALDIDPTAVNATQINAAMNGVDSIVEASQQDLPESPVPLYDVVIANLFPNVLIPLLPALSRTLAPSGVLILSGAVTARCEDILRHANAAGLSIKERKEEKQWAALIAGFQE